MPQQGFSSTVSAWVRETIERQRAVFQEATNRVIDVMQTPMAAGGRMRIATGFLRASLVATLGDPGFKVTYQPNDITKVSYNEASVAAVIAGATINDKISAVYTANYAIPREYGARGQPPDAFVRMAVQMWPQIVAQTARDAQSGSFKR